MAERDAAQDTIANLKRQLKLEKKGHEVTRRETQLAYSLLDEAYKL